MIDLFSRLDRYIDYNNSYSMRKALNTLSKEFNIAVSKKNIAYAREVTNAAKKLYDKLSKTYRESEDKGSTMSYSQKVLAKKTRSFIAYLIQKTKSELGVANNYEQEIEQTING